VAEAPSGTPGDLDAEVRRLDGDRWLASRLIADPSGRAAVVAISALNIELARVGEQVSNPLAGEIRLAWWRERLEAMVAGGEPPAQPALQALSLALPTLPFELLDALVEARHADLEPRPFADDAALAHYLDGTAGAIMGLSARALDPEAPLRAVVEAGRAWGLAGLYRARDAWRAHNRDWTPESWGELDDAALAARVRAEVDTALDRARSELAALSVAAFPAVAYVGLAALYARGRTPGELERRARIVWASLRGQV
jgi:15-cis-phytoene synthase